MYNEKLEVDVFSFENCGSKKITKKYYKQVENTIDLIDKVIYISKNKKIKIDYNIDEFIEKEEYINIIYNEINHKKYKSNREFTSRVQVPLDFGFDEISKNIDKLVYISPFEEINIFNQKINLKNYVIKMFDIKIENEEKNDKGFILKIISNNVIFEKRKDQ